MLKDLIKQHTVHKPAHYGVPNWQSRCVLLNCQYVCIAYIYTCILYVSDIEELSMLFGFSCTWNQYQACRNQLKSEVPGAK